MKLLLALLLAGCATTGQPVNGGTTQLTVYFVTDIDEIHAACPALQSTPVFGCAKVRDGACEVYLLQPRGFDDRRRLETLGHETLHCLGGKHS